MMPKDSAAMPRKRVAVLISGRGSNMAALIAAARAPDYPADIAVVISNRPQAAGLAQAAAAGIETVAFDHSKFGTDRAAFDAALQRAFEARRIELVCLAGFMRLLTPLLVDRWQGRMLNIHPSLLPAFRGLDTHAAALAAGVRIHGASVHFVVPEVDAGPIICQGAIAVRDDDTPNSLAARVLAVEHRLYPMALRWVAEGRVHIVGARCRLDGIAASESGLLMADGANEKTPDRGRGLREKPKAGQATGRPFS
jgi:phosphoribosylglycinamide formyltransferase-1